MNSMPRGPERHPAGRAAAYAEGMDPAQLALLELLAGIVIGGGVTALVAVSLRVQARQRADASPAPPDGVREVLRAMEDPAAAVDLSGTVRAASPAAAAFGLHEGSTIADDQVRGLVRDARAGGSATASLVLRRADGPGEQSSVSARAATVTDRLVLVVLRDITERERIERMRRDFVANTSHELKTPVGAISLLAEAIEAAADDPAQVRAFASRMSAEATRLAGLTDRVMHLSRLQGADEALRMRRLAVDDLLAEVVAAHETTAAAAGISLARGDAEGLHVLGDPRILGDAVGNLVANAVAYSPAGAQVGIGVKRVKDAVEIAVTDHGPGIPVAEQERIFERFYRADHARSRRTGGTGLGLSIVKHAVDRHGGEVEVWSRPGRGSTFTIRLPLADPAGKGGKKKPKQKRKKKTKDKVSKDKGNRVSTASVRPRQTGASA